MNTTAFLAGLDCAVRQLLATVQTELEPLGLAQLNQQPAPNAWSVLECLEHLNRYSRYYNPQMARAVATPAGRPTAEVRHSWLGRKFIAMMAPGNTQKAKTLQRMNPGGIRLDGGAVLSEFYTHQHRLLELLAQAGAADLNRKAVPVEFLKLLKMRVGEAFEFVIVHQQRHVQQALRAKEAAQAPAATGPLLVAA
ncbi:DinB family protein [Hymenobacter ruricola]|uniref:DinB family protein n=1 Tax=Hymenobacter ruricola TaxID=2791023 RepID=A0ABS0IA92_9BACT|nr:DinB family protein [Hymenobacter ruricola]MBF9223902.1 DinB family protein [Hymenobacter ruricola]